MWRLKKIEVENFRSYRGRHILELGDVNILWGRIGAGKTSILYAIEYALFGKQLEVKERVAKLIDLINTDSQELKVSLTLQKGGDTLYVSRVMGRRGSERLTIRLNNVELKGRDAEKKLKEILGVDEDIYERLVYISHRTLEGFIYGTLQKRALSVDRLFGVDLIDDVIKHISSFEKILINRAEELRKKIASYEKYKEIIRKYGGYRGLISRLHTLSEEISILKEKEAALAKKVEELARERSEYIERLKEKESVLIEYYKTKSELEFLESSVDKEPDVATVEKIRSALREVLEEYEHMVGSDFLDKLSKTNDLESLSTILINAYEEIVKLSREIETQLYDSKKLYDHYTTRLRRVEDEISNLETKLRRLEPQYQRFKELQKKYKSLEDVKTTLVEIKKKLEELERAVSYSSALRTVALHVFERGISTCPICGTMLDSTAVSKLIEELDSKYGELVKELEDLRTGVYELERALVEMETLTGDVSEYLSTKSHLAELQRERDEIVNRILQLEKSIKQLERRVEKIRQLLAKVDRKVIYDAVSKFGKSIRIRELRRRLRELEDILKKSGVTEEVINIDSTWRETAEEFEKISSRLSEYFREKRMLEEVEREVGGDVENLRKDLDNVLYAYGKFQNIKSRLELVKINTRSRMLERARDKFNEVFLALYRYGDIVKVGADLEQRKGYYDFYALGPAGERFGISKLSDGQRLSMALALALALREVSNVGVDFIIFDEPIPYVDVNIRRAFVDLVKSLAHSRQLIVATQSREFAEEIREALSMSKFFKIVKEKTSRIDLD